MFFRLAGKMLDPANTVSLPIKSRVKPLENPVKKLKKLKENLTRRGKPENMRNLSNFASILVRFGDHLGSPSGYKIQVKIRKRFGRHRGTPKSDPGHPMAATGGSLPGRAPRKASFLRLRFYAFAYSLD